MAQNYTIDMFAPGNQVQIDMQNIENNLECLRSMFFGLTAPANPLAGMPWYGAGGRDSLRVRNVDNTAWLAVLFGDVGHKTWVYRNAATTGWIVDATVADVVLAVKGGAQAYNVSGGELAGTWVQPSHTLTILEIPSHNHGGSTGGYAYLYQSENTSYPMGVVVSFGYHRVTTSSYSHNHSISFQGGGAAHNHGSTYRPSAAVGTLQYPDLT